MNDQILLRIIYGLATISMANLVFRLFAKEDKLLLLVEVVSSVAILVVGFIIGSIIFYMI